MTVKGQSWLQSGDVIEFDVLSVENKQNSGGHLDPQYSGRYIITAIRHRVANDKFLQILTCVKDSSKTGFGYANKSFTEIAGLKAIGSSQDIDERDSQPSHKTPRISKGRNPFGYS